MTFEEWLESDEGVLRFGRELRPEWIADARIVWDAAIEAAAIACDDFSRNIEVDTEVNFGDCFAEEVRALSSNETPKG